MYQTFVLVCIKVKLKQIQVNSSLCYLEKIPKAMELNKPERCDIKNRVTVKTLSLFVLSALKTDEAYCIKSKRLNTVFLNRLKPRQINFIF